jgi:ABC-type xylose transport system permease subunit
LKPSKENSFNFATFVKKYTMELILGTLIIVLILTAPGFFSLPNILNIFRNVALAGVISFGMTMTIIGGESIYLWVLRLPSPQCSRRRLPGPLPRPEPCRLKVLSSSG